jgi:hypothetical protein
LNALSSIAVDRGLAGSTTTSKVSMNRTLGGGTDSTDRADRLTDEPGTWPRVFRRRRHYGA